jgi:hypothetical protein
VIYRCFLRWGPCRPSGSAPSSHRLSPSPVLFHPNTNTTLLRARTESSRIQMRRMLNFEANLHGGSAKLVMKTTRIAFFMKTWRGRERETVDCQGSLVDTTISSYLNRARLRLAGIVRKERERVRRVSYQQLAASQQKNQQRSP